MFRTTIFLVFAAVLGIAGLNLMVFMQDHSAAQIGQKIGGLFPSPEEASAAARRFTNTTDTGNQAKPAKPATRTGPLKCDEITPASGWRVSVMRVTDERGSRHDVIGTHETKVAECLE